MVPVRGVKDGALVFVDSFVVWKFPRIEMAYGIDENI